MLVGVAMWAWLGEPIGKPTKKMRGREGWLVSRRKKKLSLGYFSSIFLYGHSKLLYEWKRQVLCIYEHSKL